MSLFPKENSSLKEEKTERNLLHLLSISINRLCNQDHCLGVKLLRDIQWWAKQSFDLSVSIINLMIWLEGSKKPLR